MSLNNLIEKLKLKDDVIERFARDLVQGRSLKEIAKSTGIPEEKVFVFAQSYSKEVLQEALEDVSPQLMEDRQRILNLDKKTLQNNVLRREHLKRLNDLFEEFALLLNEKWTKKTGA